MSTALSANQPSAGLDVEILSLARQAYRQAAALVDENSSDPVYEEMARERALSVVQFLEREIHAEVSKIIGFTGLIGTGCLSNDAECQLTEIWRAAQQLINKIEPEIDPEDLTAPDEREAMLLRLINGFVTKNRFAGMSGKKEFRDLNARVGRALARLCRRVYSDYQKPDKAFYKEIESDLVPSLGGDDELLLSLSRRLLGVKKDHVAIAPISSSQNTGEHLEVWRNYS